MSDADAERHLLSAVAAAPAEAGFDSSTLGWDTTRLVGLIKSLESAELVTAKARTLACGWWPPAGVRGGLCVVEHSHPPDDARRDAPRRR